MSHRYDIDLFALARLLLRRRRWIIGLAGSTFVLATIIMFSTPNRYRSHSIILPSGGKGSDMSAIKELVGIGGSIGFGQENSSALYPVILQSNLIKDSVLAQTYTFSFDDEPRTVKLSNYFGNDDPDRLRRYLSGITNISANKRTGEIRLWVETRYPQLSRAVLNEYLRQLETFNRFTRRSVARDNELYLEKRLGQAGIELAAAEKALREFRKTNADWAASTDAGILDELTRLQRNLEIRSGAEIVLQKQYEMARFNSAKDVPIVRIMDYPSLPTMKSGPRRVVTIMGLTMLVFMLTAIGIILGDLWRQMVKGGNQTAYSALCRDARQSFSGTRRVINLVRRQRSKAESPPPN